MAFEGGAAGLSNQYTDYSAVITTFVIVCLVSGILGVLAFLQYKFVCCQQFLCMRCRRKNGSMTFVAGDTPTAANFGETAGVTVDAEQFNANDLISKRAKWNKDELVEEADDSDSQRDYTSKNMLKNNDMMSAQEINPDNLSISGSAVEKGKAGMD